MTPHEQRLVSVIEGAADDIVASLDRQRIPLATSFAIAFQVAISLLDRMEPELRRNLASALITRLTAIRRLDA